MSIMRPGGGNGGSVCAVSVDVRHVAATQPPKINCLTRILRKQPDSFLENCKGRKELSKSVALDPFVFAASV